MNLFVNEELLAQTTALAAYSDRGLLLGDGLFETIRAENGALLFFDAHYQRLKKAAFVLGMNFKLSLELLKSRCQQLIIANQLENSTASLRITLTRGHSSRGIDIPEKQNLTVLIHAIPYNPINIHPKSVYITNMVRNEYSPIVHIKTTNYLEFILAKKQALEQGYDDGLLLNTKGAITELTTANIFIVIGDKIMTPSLTDGVLPGVTRQTILTIAHDLKLAILEKTIYPTDITHASECFVTNSLIEIQSVSSINEHRFLIGSAAKQTEGIKEAYYRYKLIST
jgi:branched-chain amino acid aminotransferase